MSGLGKPPSRRGAPAVRRLNLFIKSFQGGALCSGQRNNSPFISSYDEDKKRKHGQQRKERAKKLLVWGSLALILTALFRSRSSTSDEPNVLRGVAEISTKLGSNNDNIIPPNNAPASAVEPPPPPPAAARDTSLPDPSVLKGKSLEIEKGLEDSICSSQIPINLADKDKWPTPYTPLLGNGKVPTDSIAKEVVLLKRDRSFGNLGSQLTSFFHAYDFAHQTKAPLYITKDSWALETLSKLFFDRDLISPRNKPEKFYPYLEKILRVKIVESEEVLKSMEISVPVQRDTNTLFYVRSGSMNSTQIRNHRETILRQLLQYPAKGVCTTFEHMSTDNKKYTVISISSSANAFLPKLGALTGKDHTVAAEMQPDYVVNILRREGMLEHTIFPIFFGDQGDDETLARLKQVPELDSLIKEHPSQKADHNLGGNVYLALLADVYLGNPTDQLSMWIARMRLSLNKQGTYVLTEKRGDDWVSYVDSANHLELYDTRKLGPWMA